MASISRTRTTRPSTRSRGAGEKRQPTFLHVKCVRLLGHAGSDVETDINTRAEIEAVEARDPLIASCRLALENGIATAQDLLTMYEQTRANVAAAGREAANGASRSRTPRT